MKDTSKKLLIAIGNVARGDDGMGWKFLDEVDNNGIEGWELVKRYQLNIEDASLVSEADTVVFVDAYNGKLPKGFLVEECHPRVDFEYSTHALNPCAVLALCNNLYEKRPETIIIKLQGYKWGLGKGLSDRGKQNVEKAASYFARKFLIEDKV